MSGYPDCSTLSSCKKIVEGGYLLYYISVPACYMIFFFINCALYV